MTTFGPYELQGLLGRGGMGDVYRAFDTEQDRTVALKLLPDGLSADPRYAQRFRRESHATARLREPHVIPIHRYGEIDGRLFIDMRLVDGVDLARVIATDGPLDPARTVEIVAQTAAALDAAHADGLVHRDVKPSNILLTASDFVYLVDFGIAHVMDTAGRQAALTTTGTAVGTVAYMAPERFSPGDLGPAADVYSLACVMYECLTASTPFPVDGMLPAIYAHGNVAPPRPTDLRRELPVALDEVIAVGMAKQPGDRFASAGELAAAARAALAGPHVERTRTSEVPTATAALPIIAADQLGPDQVDTGTPAYGFELAERGRGRRAVLAAAGVLLVVAAAVAVVLLSPWERSDGGPPATSPLPGSGFPTAFGGTWTGRLSQTGGTTHAFAAELVVAPGKDTAQLRFLELQCTGQLRLRVAEPATLTAVEEISSGPCSTGVDVRLRLLPTPDTLAYEFSGPGSSGSGTLTRS